MKNDDQSIDIPVDAEVHCKDGRSGSTKAVIVNPLTRKLSHVVVDYEGREYLVPLEEMAATTPDLIVLDCRRDELEEKERFDKRAFLSLDFPERLYEGDYYVEPLVYGEEDFPQSMTVVVKEENIPPGGLSIRRGNEVYAADELTGTVDELVVDRKSGEISHIILREGHLWGKRDITIPVNEILKIEYDQIFLKLNKKAVSALPSVSVERWWD